MSLPMAKFNTATTVRGISSTSILLAIFLSAPILLPLQLFIGGIPLILLSIVLIWRVMVPIAEWLTEVIPPRYFAHVIDWLIAGGQMYVTNDSSPIPLVMERRKTVVAQQREQERLNHRLTE